MQFDFQVVKNKTLEEMMAMNHCYYFNMDSYSNREQIKSFCQDYRENLYFSMGKKRTWRDWLTGKKFTDKYAKIIYKQTVAKVEGTDCEQFLKSVKKYKNIYQESVPYINLLATNYCNLNCKGCGALMPVYNRSKEKYNMPIETLEKLLTRYNELSHNGVIGVIDIVGGEPLLHPNIIEFMKVVRKYNPQSTINLITNGLLIPNMTDDFFKVATECRIKLALSIYGKGTYFEKINISHDETIPSAECSFCCGHAPVIFPEYKRVSIGGVPLLANGDLFYCGFNAIEKLNEYFKENFELVKGVDYVNIFEIDSFQEILDMMQQPHCNFHKYCKQREIFEWDVSCCDKYEWVKNP